MNVLALDTSGPICGVAVLRDKQIVSEHMVLNQRTHSVNLLPMIDESLGEAGLTLNDMHRIACVTGPGSFTGVRIGVSTAKGLSHGSGIPCVALDALEALAYGAAYLSGIICAMQDARAGQVYAACFQTRDGAVCRLGPDQPIAVKELLSGIRERCLFLGDGMEVHRAEIREALGERAVLPPPHLSFIRPSSVAVLGHDAAEEVDYRTLMPLYLRAPSAQRNRELMEAQAHG